MSILAPEQEQGEFNQATAYQFRLHTIFLNLDDATLDQDYPRQYRLLRALYKELYPMMNDKKGEERKTLSALKKETDTAYQQYLTVIAKGKRSISASVIAKFDDLEMALRDLTQRKNMLMPQKKDSRMNF